MCTYNGIQYLEPQLASLLTQTRMPDQLTIFDDCSDDGTWEYLQTWVAGVPIAVSLHRNDTTQGVVKNFESATRTLKTDVIFLCDQDDVWLDSKVDSILKVFESDSNVSLVHTDAQLIDEDANDLGVSLFNALGLTERERGRVHAGDVFPVLCRRNLVTGATAAFRRELLHLALPFPDCWLHDEWLAILAAATGRVVLLDTATIQYRQHARNVVGMAVPSFTRNMQRFFRLFRLSAGEFQAKRAKRATVLLERLRTLPTIPREYMTVLNDALAHARFRSSLPLNPMRRLWAVLYESHTGRYRQFSSGYRGVLRDILNR